MSDRIALLADGALVQYGTPYELYTRPANEVTARFLGESNILHGIPTRRAEEWTVDIAGDTVVLPRAPHVSIPGERVALFLRPHRMTMDPAGAAGVLGPGRCRLHGTIAALIYAGDSCKAHVRLSTDDVIVVRCDSTAPSRFALGDAVDIGWRTDDALLLD